MIFSQAVGHASAVGEIALLDNRDCGERCWGRDVRGGHERIGEFLYDFVVQRIKDLRLDINHVNTPCAILSISEATMKQAVYMGAAALKPFVSIN